MRSNPEDITRYESITTWFGSSRFIFYIEEQEATRRLEDTLWYYIEVVTGYAELPSSIWEWCKWWHLLALKATMLWRMKDVKFWLSILRWTKALPNHLVFFLGAHQIIFDSSRRSDEASTNAHESYIWWSIQRWIKAMPNHLAIESIAHHMIWEL